MACGRTGYGWSMVRIAGLLALLSGGLGCSESGVRNYASEPSPSFSDASDPPNETDSDATADSGLVVPEAAYYALNLAFTVEAEGWSAASLQIDLYDPEIERVCSHEIPVQGVTAEAPPTEEPLLTWWKLELGEGVSEGPCPGWPARTWWLGFGSYDPQLDPAMAAGEMLGYEVYGLYLKETTGGPIYVVGVGGPPESLAGETDLVVEAPPLPDGSYEALSLVALSL